MFNLLWSSAPILVSVISFLTYAAQGHKLTVGIAFTALTLFNYIRVPLNVIPTWIVQILQTGVALNRVATFLDEEEVNEQVSSLKKDFSSASSQDQLQNEHEGLGIESGSFKWNEVPEQEKDVKASNGSTTPRASDVLSEETLTDHRFELNDISLKVQEGVLTCITGPTASGKTALLASWF